MVVVDATVWVKPIPDSGCDKGATHKDLGQNGRFMDIVTVTQLQSKNENPER
jgi:hypothetical protein